jgi:hypothetical protein
VTLSGEVECDETHPVAGRKGQPGKVAGAGRKPRRRRLKGARGRGTGATEKPPIFGMAQRSGEAAIRLLDNVRQKTIKPLILQTVAAGTLMHTDGYSIYGRLPEWGYGHKTVNHSKGEHARDEDGDGFHEIHVNTVEGLWSLLRSWLAPPRHLAGQAAAVPGFFRVRLQPQKARQAPVVFPAGSLAQKDPETHIEPK